MVEINYRYSCTTIILSKLNATSLLFKMEP